jgi:integrase
VFKTLWKIRTLSKNSQRTYAKHLKRLNRDTNLNNPIETEKFIFELDCKNKTKNNYLIVYKHYCEANELEWVRPFLTNEPSVVKVPTEERINMVISSCSFKYSTIFHLSKMGLRPDEISKVILRDLDLERGEINVRTSKLGLDRTLRLRPETRDLLKDYICMFGITQVSQRLFPSAKTIRNRWIFYRNRAFTKFKDPELLKIRCYDLRHWFGTMTYIKTRDLLFTKYLMGHRNLESTLHYMHISKGLINFTEEYTVKIAASIEQFTSARAQLRILEL